MYDNYQFKELKWPSLKALTPKNYRRNNYLTSLLFLGTILFSGKMFYVYKDWFHSLDYWKQRRDNRMRQKESFNIVIGGHNTLESNFIKQFSSF